MQVLDFTYPFPCKVIAYADDLVLCAFDRDPEKTEMGHPMVQKWSNY